MPEIGRARPSLMPGSHGGPAAPPESEVPGSHARTSGHNLGSGHSRSYAEKDPWQRKGLQWKEPFWSGLAQAPAQESDEILARVGMDHQLIESGMRLGQGSIPRLLRCLCLQVLSIDLQLVG
jgi:hypothetical protein